MKVFWQHLGQSMGRFFNAYHYLAVWIALAIIILAIAYSIYKYRGFWIAYWKRVLLAVGIIAVVVLSVLLPKIMFWYDTRLVLPKTLSAQEKKQYMDERENILKNDQGLGKNN